ncbi:MAG TPA: class I SAM-dependent methyltransferase [Gemmataceae bacterium]|nr:class I SAM-dependent methyltransferase [Gemmataceae bacterium]
MAGRLIAKIKKTFRREGLFGTLKKAVVKVYSRILDQTPARRRAKRLKEKEDREFDRQFNVHTAGFVPLDRLGFGSSNKDHGFAHDPIDPTRFQRTVGSLKIRHEDFVFIDFGSGKGRSLLLASQLPFRKIIGVEFAPELHQIAEQNVRSFRCDGQKCKDIELVCGDAAEYALPPLPTVVYFFNPFGAEVMARVIANIRKSWAEHPREMYVVYVTPVVDELWAAADFVERVSSQKGYCSVYKARAPG